MVVPSPSYGSSATRRPSWTLGRRRGQTNDQMQDRAKHGLDGASPLISVLGRRGHLMGHRLTLDTNLLLEYWKEQAKMTVVTEILALATAGDVSLAVTARIRED